MNKQLYGTKKTPQNCISIAILGEGNVGKSCCTLQFLYNKFDENHNATIEDTYSTVQTIDNNVYYLEIVDTSGQDEFVQLQDSLFRSCDGFLFVYDVTNRSSWEFMKLKHKSLMMVQSRKDQVPAVLFGNKTDLLRSDKNKRQVSTVENDNLAKSLGAVALEGSALLGENIHEAFFEVVRQVQLERNAMKERLDNLKKHQKNPLPNASKKGISTSSKSQAMEDLNLFESKI